MRALQSPPSRLLAEGREQTRDLSGPAASPCSPPALCSPPARDDGLEDEQWDMEAMVLSTIAGFAAILITGCDLDWKTLDDPTQT